MITNNSRTLLVKAAGLLGVASLSVLISLPGFSQQSPGNTNTNVPSTVKPTNPGGRDAGTTNGGENLERVPSSNTNMQQNNSSGQPSSTPISSDPASNPAPSNSAEGREQGNQDRNNITPGNPSQSGSYSKPGANQPGATTGGDSSQQVERNQNNGSTMQQNSGSTMQRNQTTPKGGYQSSPQPRSQSDTNSGSTTDGTSTAQEQPSNGGVRALW